MSFTNVQIGRPSALLSKIASSWNQWMQLEERIADILWTIMIIRESDSLNYNFFAIIIYKVINLFRILSK